MKKYCVVISKIIRKEISIEAATEEEAINKAKRLYEEGYVHLEKHEDGSINFHPKY